MTDTKNPHPALADTSTPAASAPGQQFPTPDRPSDKSFIATWLLAWLVGFLGVDRFYLGKVGTGLLKLLTFGGFGVWWLVDLILVLAGAQRDKQGRALSGYNAQKKVAWIVTAAVVVLSMITSGAVNAASPHASTAVAPIEKARAEEVALEDAPTVADPSPVAAEPTPIDEATVQSWADDTFGTFTPVTQTGTGDNLVTLPTGAKAGIITATHDGSSNFSISVLDASNASTGQLLVNTIGAYSGTTSYGFNALGDGVTLQITADGNWNLTISPVSAAPELAASGAGDGVFLYDGPAGKLAAIHDGSSNFAVSVENGKAFSFGLLINEIGAYSGTVPINAGPAVIDATADGKWTLTVG